MSHLFRGLVLLEFDNADNTSLAGGVADEGGLFSITGDQYYSGSETAPTFITGTYSGQSDHGTSQSATVKITDVSAGVPEPAAWTLMLAGFGGLGGGLRARRRAVAA